MTPAALIIDAFRLPEVRTWVKNVFKPQEGAQKYTVKDYLLTPSPWKRDMPIGPRLGQMALMGSRWSIPFVGPFVAVIHVWRVFKDYKAHLGLFQKPLPTPVNPVRVSVTKVVDDLLSGTNSLANRFARGQTDAAIIREIQRHPSMTSVFTVLATQGVSMPTTEEWNTLIEEIVKGKIEEGKAVSSISRSMFSSVKTPVSKTNPVTIGRNSDQTIPIFDGEEMAVSRTHASISWNGSAFTLDTSANGTTIFRNNKSVNVTKNVPIILEKGDYIRLGKKNVYLVFTGTTIDGPYFDLRNLSVSIPVSTSNVDAILKGERFTKNALDALRIRIDGLIYDSYTIDEANSVIDEILYATLEDAGVSQTEMSKGNASLRKLLSIDVLLAKQKERINFQEQARGMTIGDGLTPRSVPDALKKPVKIYKNEYFNASGTEKLVVDIQNDATLRNVLDRAISDIVSMRKASGMMLSRLDAIAQWVNNPDNFRYSKSTQQKIYDFYGQEANLGEFVIQGGVCREKAFFVDTISRFLGIQSEVWVLNFNPDGRHAINYYPERNIFVDATQSNQAMTWDQLKTFYARQGLTIIESSILRFRNTNAASENMSTPPVGKKKCSDCNIVIRTVSSELERAKSLAQVNPAEAMKIIQQTKAYLDHYFENQVVFGALNAGIETQEAQNKPTQAEKDDALRTITDAQASVERAIQDATLTEAEKADYINYQDALVSLQQSLIVLDVTSSTTGEYTEVRITNARNTIRRGMNTAINAVTEQFDSVKDILIPQSDQKIVGEITPLLPTIINDVVIVQPNLTDEEAIVGFVKQTLPEKLAGNKAFANLDPTEQGRIIELLEPSIRSEIQKSQAKSKTVLFHPSEAGMLNIGLIWEGLKEAWNAGSERIRRILPNSLNTNEQPLDMAQLPAIVQDVWGSQIGNAITTPERTNEFIALIQKSEKYRVFIGGKILSVKEQGQINAAIRTEIEALRSSSIQTPLVVTQTDTQSEASNIESIEPSPNRQILSEEDVKKKMNELQQAYENRPRNEIEKTFEITRSMPPEVVSIVESWVRSGRSVTAYEIAEFVDAVYSIPDGDSTVFVQIYIPLWMKQYEWNNFGYITRIISALAKIPQNLRTSLAQQYIASWVRSEHIAYEIPDLIWQINKSPETAVVILPYITKWIEKAINNNEDSVFRVWSLVNTLQNIPSPTLAGMLPMIQSWVDAGMTQLYNLSDLVYVLNETPDALRNAYFKTYIPTWMASGLKDSWFISQCIRSLNSRPDTIALIAPNIPLWVSLEKQHEQQWSSIATNFIPALPHDASELTILLPYIPQWMNTKNYDGGYSLSTFVESLYRPTAKRDFLPFIGPLLNLGITHSKIESLISKISGSDLSSFYLSYLPIWIQDGAESIDRLDNLIPELDKSPQEYKTAYIQTYIPVWIAAGMTNSYDLYSLIDSLNNATPDEFAQIAPNIELLIQYGLTGKDDLYEVISYAKSLPWNVREKYLVAYLPSWLNAGLHDVSDILKLFAQWNSPLTQGQSFKTVFNNMLRNAYDIRSLISYLNLLPVRLPFTTEKNPEDYMTKHMKRFIKPWIDAGLSDVHILKKVMDTLGHTPRGPAIVPLIEPLIRAGFKDEMLVSYISLLQNLPQETFSAYVRSFILPQSGNPLRTRDNLLSTLLQTSIEHGHIRVIPTVLLNEDTKLSEFGPKDIVLLLPEKDQVFLDVFAKNPSMQSRLSELDGFEYFVSSLQGKTVEEMIAKIIADWTGKGSIHLVIGNMLPVMSDAVLSLLPTEMNHFWKIYLEYPALRWRLGEYDGFSYVQKILYGKSSQEMIAMVVQDAPPMSVVTHMMEVLTDDVLLLLTPDQQIFWKGIIELNKAKIDVRDLVSELGNKRDIIPVLQYIPPSQWKSFSKRYALYKSLLDIPTITSTIRLQQTGKQQEAIGLFRNEIQKINDIYSRF